jgi:hypothetical protein
LAFLRWAGSGCEPVEVAGMACRVVITVLVACSFVGVNSFVTNVPAVRSNERSYSRNGLISSLHMNLDEQSTRISRRNLFAAFYLIPSLFFLSSNEANAKEVINDCEPWYHKPILCSSHFGFLYKLRTVLMQDNWKKVADRKELQGQGRQRP